MNTLAAQVNDFLKLLAHTGALDGVVQRLQSPAGAGGGASPEQRRALCILDCGCGSSHLTLCTWHYVNNGARAACCGQLAAP